MRVTLTITDGPYTGQVFDFAGHDTFLVGRAPHAHCRLPQKDRMISRTHFLIEVNPPSLRLTDLGSHNGTYVNDERVNQIDLRHGDVIRAGQTRFRVGIEVPTTAAGDEATVQPRPVKLTPRGTAGPPTSGELPEIRVGRYRCLRELGRGGMGVVYLAEDDAGVRVALKTIAPAAAASPRQVDRFVREAEVLRQLDHPHIVGFRDIGQADGCLYFAMEYVPGQDAASLLARDGSFPPRVAVKVACQLLDALAYAHDRGFVHRDIKPANLLLTKQHGRVTLKLADFGLARVYQASHLSGLTMMGEVGGTAAYMPPEQITNYREVKPAADQYAASATLYTLLTGQHVYDFAGPSVQALLTILDKDPVPIRERKADIGDALAAAIHRALTRDPDQRHPNVRAFRAALVAACP